MLDNIRTSHFLKLALWTFDKLRNNVDPVATKYDPWGIQTA